MKWASLVEKGNTSNSSNLLKFSFILSMLSRGFNLVTIVLLQILTLIAKIVFLFYKKWVLLES